jgi:hypothetical protein
VPSDTSVLSGSGVPSDSAVATDSSGVLSDSAIATDSSSVPTDSAVATDTAIATGSDAPTDTGVPTDTGLPSGPYTACPEAGAAGGGTRDPLAHSGSDTALLAGIAASLLALGLALSVGAARIGRSRRAH